MIPRHPALSVELRNEADDLRRYARELDASGDAESAAAVRDQSMHVEGWVDVIVELEADSAELRELLELVDGADTPGKLASRIAELESGAEGLADVAAEVEELRASLKERTSELEEATRERDELESRVEEATRERDELESRVDADFMEPVKITWETLRRCPKGSDGRIAYLKTQILDEVVDRLPLPPSVTYTISRMLEEDATYEARNASIERLVDVVASKAETLATIGAAKTTEAHRSALVELLEALASVEREDENGDGRRDNAIAAARALVGVAAPAAPVVVDPQGAAREALRLAIERREETRAALATLNADHPLQLAYEAELEAELRRLKPKGKVPRLEGGRLDVVAASAKLPDGGHAIRDRYAVEVKRIREELDAAHTAAVDAVVAAALDVTPRTTDGARTLLADVWLSTYSTQTAPELYARGMIAIEDKTAYANCPGILPVQEEIRNARGEITALRLYGNVEPLDAEAIRIKGLELPERVRLAYASGCNPRVYWPTLPHGYEERHGLDRFGGRTVKP